MLFTAIMSRKKVYTYVVLIVILFLGWIFSNVNIDGEDFPERVKVSLRDVGNQLLLSNKDSTSLVLPVVELGENRYEILFQKQLSFEPSNLVIFVKIIKRPIKVC